MLEFGKLNPVGSRTGILYGLSKVHKTLVNGLPKMRPILSAIGTVSYCSSSSSSSSSISLFQSSTLKTTVKPGSI